MADGGYELPRRPVTYGFGRRKFGGIDIDDARVRGGKLFTVRQSLAVNLLGEVEASAARFRESDQFFEPGCASGLQVNSRVEFFHGAADGFVDGELVAAGVNAQFEVVGESISLDGEGDDRDVIGELFGELGEVAYVVYTFVETPGEFRSDGLDRDAFLRDSRQDNEKFGGCLGRVRFIHGNFRDEVPLSFGLFDMPVDPAGVLNGGEVLARDSQHEGAIRLDGPVNARNSDGADQLGMLIEERRDARFVGRFADEIRDVQSEKIARLKEAVNRVEIDVVGVQEVG